MSVALFVYSRYAQRLQVIEVDEDGHYNTSGFLRKPLYTQGLMWEEVSFLFSFYLCDVEEVYDISPIFLW